MTTQSKKCSKCYVVKPLTDYNQDARMSDGRRSDCRSCRKGGYSTPAGKAVAKDRNLKHNHNITLEDFDRMFQTQGHACAICRRADKAPYHIDHNHDCCPTYKSCGKCIRAILCSGCNSGIGGLRDDPALVAAALGYLKTHVKNQV